MSDRPFIPASKFVSQSATVGQLYRPPCFLRVIRIASSYEKPVECQVKTKWLMCVCCGRIKDILHCNLMVVDKSANIVLDADEIGYKYLILMHICHGCAIKQIEFTMEEFLMLPGVILEDGR